MRKRALVITKPRHMHAHPWGEAFAAGLRRHGWDAQLATKYSPCDMMVMWGVRRKEFITQAKKSGADVCILECGYMGDRLKWSSVSFGGALNGRAAWRGVRDDPSRFKEHFSELLKPWRSPRRYRALLIGQLSNDMSVAHADLNAWYTAAVNDLTARGWDVLFRPHPIALAAKRHGVTSLPGTTRCTGPLNNALAIASIAVTFNSNTGVEAVLAGVPTIACDAGSMAHPVAGHRIGEIITPDREKWASRLAWCQWTMDEFASGACWDVAGGLNGA